jgi:NTP pyrophosphatase (non-canonical NTP hydrolase)
MKDNIRTIEEMKRIIDDYSKKRGWDLNENPKDLVMALSVETSELLEIFQWVHSDKADSIKDDPKEFEHLKEEISDVFWYLIRICNHFNIDLTEAVEDKAIKNARKYQIK